MPGYQTPALRDLLTECSNKLDPFNKNEDKDLFDRIQIALRWGNDSELQKLAENMAQAYETGESCDMHAAVHLYRLKYPKSNVHPS